MQWPFGNVRSSFVHDHPQYRTYARRMKPGSVKTVAFSRRWISAPGQVLPTVEGVQSQASVYAVPFVDGGFLCTCQVLPSVEGVQSQASVYAVSFVDRGFLCNCQVLPRIEGVQSQASVYAVSIVRRWLGWPWLLGH
jgi:hypothetical protein